MHSKAVPTLLLLIGLLGVSAGAQTPEPQNIPQAAPPTTAVSRTPKSEEKQTKADLKAAKNREKADKATRREQKDQDKLAKDQAKAASKTEKAGQTPQTAPQP